MKEAPYRAWVCTEQGVHSRLARTQEEAQRDVNTLLDFFEHVFGLVDDEVPEHGIEHWIDGKWVNSPPQW